VICKADSAGNYYIYHYCLSLFVTTADVDGVAAVAAAAFAD